MSARTCPVEGCEKDVRTKGYCDTHYRRWRKYGDPCAPDQSTRAKARAEREAEPKVTRDPDALIEDLRWMAETGESFIGAAARLGMTPKALEKFLTRHRRTDLRATLAARNPRDHNKAPDGSAVTSLAASPADRERAKRRRRVTQAARRARKQEAA